MADRHDEHNPISRDHHRVEPSAGDVVGEGVGGVSGALTGAALGSMGGPIGTIIGGIAGAAGGWWTGRSVSEVAAHYTHDEDKHYRGHWDAHDNQPADWDYDRARTGYAVGHIAGRNPDYRGKSFEEVEADIKRGFSGEHEKDWEQMRPLAKHSYERTVIRTHDDDDRVVIKD